MNNEIKFSICYLADNFLAEEILDDDSIIKSPESLKNSKQIQDWVAKLKTEPKKFFTTSLYLLRELYLQKIYVKYINITDNKLYTSFNVNDIGNIEILDRDLEQSERYINFENINKNINKNISK